MNKSIKGVNAIFIIFLIMIQLTPNGCSTREFDKISFYIHFPIEKGDYELYSVFDYLNIPIRNFTLYIEWQAEPEIDVFIVDGSNMERYREGRPIVTIWETTGNSGIINLSFPFDYDLEPYYVIFDNSDYGKIKPPQNVKEHSINFTAKGYHITHFFPHNDDKVDSLFQSAILVMLTLLIIIISISMILILYFKSKTDDNLSHNLQSTENLPSIPLNQKLMGFFFVIIGLIIPISISIIFLKSIGFGGTGYSALFIATIVPIGLIVHGYRILSAKWSVNIWSWDLKRKG